MTVRVAINGFGRIGRNVFREYAEIAGACFSPDGKTLFINIYWPGITLAITGPWSGFRS